MLDRGLPRPLLAESPCIVPAEIADSLPLDIDAHCSTVVGVRIFQDNRGIHDSVFTLITSFAADRFERFLIVGFTDNGKRVKQIGRPVAVDTVSQGSPRYEFLPRKMCQEVGHHQSAVRMCVPTD